MPTSRGPGGGVGITGLIASAARGGIARAPGGVPFGPATSRPPRTVAAITIPALTSTTSLITYCPSSEGARWGPLNISPASSRSGDSAPSNCTPNPLGGMHRDR